MSPLPTYTPPSPTRKGPPICTPSRVGFFALQAGKSVPKQAPCTPLLSPCPHKALSPYPPFPPSCLLPRIITSTLSPLILCPHVPQTPPTPPELSPPAPLHQGHPLPEQAAPGAHPAHRGQAVPGGLRPGAPAGGEATRELSAPGLSPVSPGAPVLRPCRCPAGMERAGLQRPEGEAGRLLPILPLFSQVRGGQAAPLFPPGCPQGCAGGVCPVESPRCGCCWCPGPVAPGTHGRPQGRGREIRGGGTRSLLPPSRSGVIGSGLCIFSKFPILDTLLYQYSLNGYPYMVSGVGGTRHPRDPTEPRRTPSLPFPSSSSSTGTGSVASPWGSPSLTSPGSSSTSTSPT